MAQSDMLGPVGQKVQDPHTKRGLNAECLQFFEQFVRADGIKG